MSKARLKQKKIMQKLWHGTSAEALEGINRYGFDRGRAGLNGKGDIPINWS